MIKRSPRAALALGIFTAAFLVRLIYLSEIRSIPLFTHLGGDPLTYDLWAHRIVAGEWLGRGVFFQAPLYPYFLACLELVFGHNLWAVRVIEIALGAAACALTYLAGEFFFSRRAGIIAGLALAFYAPAIFYSALIDKSALDPFFVALVLVFLGAASERFAPASTVAAGIALGLLALTRENALIWVAPIGAWMWLRPEASALKRAAAVAIFAAGLALVLLPVGLRNLIAGGQFTVTTSQAGYNFFIGNNAAADGTYASVRAAVGDHQFEQQEAVAAAEQGAGRELTPAEVSRYWFARSWEYMRAEPAAWAKLQWRKWLLTWNIREIEDSDDFYIYQQWSPPLKSLAAVSHFGTLAALAAAGLVLTWRQWRRLWLLYFMTASFAAGVALFHVVGRHRFPMVPLLALFAGAAVSEACLLWRKRNIRPLLGGAAAFGLAAAFTWTSMTGPLAPSAEGYNNLGRAYAVAGKVDLAIANAEQALRVDPKYGVAHFNLGNLYANLSRRDEAIREYREAIRIYPRFVEPRIYLARDLAARGDIAAAVEEYRQALRIRPSADAHEDLGRIFARRGDIDGAIEHDRAALKLDGSRQQLRLDLAGLLLQRGRVEEAAEQYREGIRVNPGFVEAHNNLGLILASQGRLDEAIAEYREALRLKPEFAMAHTNLGDALLLEGKKDEGVSHLWRALELDPKMESARTSLKRALAGGRESER